MRELKCNVSSSKNEGAGEAGWWYATALPLAVFSVALCLLGRAFWLAGAGFDFTDESYYLLTIQSPGQYRPMLTLFGYAFHPAYVVLQGDVLWLRVFNLLCVLVLFGTLFLRAAQLQSSVRFSLLELIAFTSAGAGVGLSFFVPWLLTPNYNSLAMAGLLVLAVAIMPLCATISQWRTHHACAVAIALWLSFLGKPSTAVAAAIVVFIVLCIRAKLWSLATVWGIGLLLALFITTSKLVTGSAFGLIEYFQQALQNASLLKSHNKALFRIDRVIWPDQTWLIVSIYVTTMLLLTNRGSLFLRKWLIALWIIFVTGCCIHLTAAPYPGDWRFAGLLFLLPLVHVTCTSIAGLFSKKIDWSLSSVGLYSAALLALPYALALGTNTNYWQAASKSAALWLLAALWPLLNMRREDCGNAKIWLILLTGQLLTSQLLAVAQVRPYRQSGPLAMYEASVAEVSGLKNLVLSDANAAVASALVDAAKLHHGNKPTMLIDLTGRMPGASYVLGFPAAGTPWMFGGYPGSESYATEILKSISCNKLATAWVLTEPGGRRRLPDEVLPTLAGAAISSVYIKVQTINLPDEFDGGGGYFHVWKPNSHLIMKSCTARN